MNSSFEKWCEKLLDTGKGNRLINFKSSLTRNIQIFRPTISELFDKLVSGTTLSFFDVDEYLKKKKKEKEFDEPIENISTEKILSSIESFGKKQVFAYKQGYSMNKILKNLKKISSESLTEKGINILYLTFGMLFWTEKGKENEFLSSPLILVPIYLEKDMVNSCYTIKEYEDEVTTNPTLIYKLKNEMDFVLPEFRQAGFEEETLFEYFDRVTNQVKQKGWFVIDESHIGTFSFLKLNMYKDLRENEEKILENTAIKKLLNQKIEDKEERIDVDTDSLEHSLHNVVDADSSQMMAIMQAKLGKSFVLQGPPGTGKSQTITNLIAEFLHDGKKILFVSEKLAALKVVFNNLKRAGLNDFCLELHSNKTNKKDVLNELYSALTRNKKFINSKAEVSVTELKKAEEQLDSYANELHTKITELDKTPYEIISEISRFRKAPSLEYAFENIQTLDNSYFEKSKELLEKFIRFTDSVGFNYKENSWYGYKNTDTSFGEKIELKKKLDSTLSLLKEINEYSLDIEDLAWIDISSLETVESNLNYIKFLSSMKFFDKNLFSKENLKAFVPAVDNFVNHKTRLETLESELFKEYSNDIFNEDVNALCLRFENDYTGFFRFLKKSYKQDKNLVLKYKINNKKSNYKKMLNALKNAREITNLRKILVQDEESVFNLLSQNESVNSYNWKEIQEEVHKLNEFDVELSKNLNNIEKEEFLNIQKKFKEFINFLDFNQDGLKELYLIQDYFDESIVNIKTLRLYEFIQKIEKLQNEFDNLEIWVRFYLCLNEVNEVKLKDFVDLYIQNGHKKEELISSFTLMYYYQWFCYIISQKPIFGEFNRQIQDMSVESFCKNDKLKFEISKAEIISKLSKEMPDINSLTSGSQMSVLVREAQKKTKQKPVRLLLKEIGQLVQTLKPCFLMSPLSVSTYLDSNTCKFDVVIFDEASQIFPWDAIGAISRATQVIVVGDSKQMPPSNFFNAGIAVEDNVTEEVEEDDALDFESILDLCSSAFSQNRLNWHYRSKTEDLIAFSNYSFYENSLVTFPSPKKNDKEMGVNFYYVPNGIFNRRSKTNTIESEKVVDLVFEHFKTKPNSSVGVVAFSISQQEEIEELISKRREKDDSFAKFFDSDKDEPFFVKNLETVQGDERDTIIFSIAYAKGDDGKFLHNFGPLNKKGGERRLNVAVTRAKYNVKVVSSIKSFDIDLNKTSAVGSRMLKEYLDMAEKGVSLWTDVKKENNAQSNENIAIGELEDEISEFLTESGYTVEKNVGCSECKIDIVVKHPEKTDYVVAIECDGPYYYSGKTTRDRDRLREEVLERLGWSYYRIWSLDWFVNKNNEKERLLRFINDSVLNFDKEKEEKNTSEKDTKELELEDNNFVVEEEFEKKDLSSMFTEYEEYKFDSSLKGHFDSIIYKLVATEAPITEELLMKKTACLFGREKVTSYVRERFYNNMERLSSKIFKTFDFYVVDKEMNITLRIPKKGAEPREITLIPSLEIASGLYVFVSHTVGITEKGLFDTIANLLGFTRVGPKIQEKLTESLKILIDSNKVKLVDNQYFKAD